ncbi:MAG TPA: thioesterase family protein [Longimicrobiales bacterium]
MESLAGAECRFRREVDVRFRDIDAMGHAHHSLALVYFEEARAAYWRDVAGQEGLDGIDYTIAEVALRYHARIRFPARLTVALRVSRLGAKSFTMEYELRSAEGTLLASGRTVQVMYDYAAGTSKPIPPEVRRRIEAFEGGVPAGG